jgi:hypothetical protein
MCETGRNREKQIETEKEGGREGGGREREGGGT